jgi:N6-adenosine-specific RNA methylase IME4
MELIIDERIKSHLPKLSEVELGQLEENILKDGCLSPLIVWGSTLVDGHNRYGICTKHEIPFQVDFLEFEDFEQAIGWVEDDQAGRGNANPDWFTYYLGRKYERVKNGHGGAREASRQNDDLKTNEKLAAEFNVGTRTVERAATFANNVDTIANHIGDSARSEILDGDVKLTRGEVGELSQDVKEAAEEGLKFSSVAEALKWAKEERAKKYAQSREERIQKIAKIAEGNLELKTDKKYPIIYADPPWRYENAPMGGANRSIENQYPTMSLEEICALPVADLATEDAILYLWATSPKLAECMKVIESWGFKYRTNFVWVKNKIGMGYHARSQHELLLVCKRGNLPPPAIADRVSSVVEGERTEHSSKPLVFYELIESFYPTLPKIELFCRSPRENWAVWGNQSGARNEDPQF